MNRAIKFKLKNGKIITIRRLRTEDFDAILEYQNTFARGPGAKYTWMYPGRPTDKESAIKLWDNPNNLHLAAWDGDKIIGTAGIHKKMPDHPWSGRVAGSGTSMLEKYTSNGLGTKFKQIVEKWARENNVHKIQTEVRHTNIRSLGNLLKQGYKIVGLVHDVAFIDGEWHHEKIKKKILDE